MRIESPGVGSFLGLALALSAPALPAQEPGDGEEPVLEMYLDLDGKSLLVHLDEPFYIDASRKAKVRASPTRLFARGPVQFRYPREYVFEHAPGDPASWTLSGNDAKVIVFRTAAGFPSTADVLLRATVDSIVKRYGASHATTSPVALELGSRTLNGTRIDATISSTRLRQDLVGFQAGKRVFMLLVQDAPRDGNPSPEAKRMLALLKETFVINP